MRRSRTRYEMAAGIRTEATGVTGGGREFTAPPQFAAPDRPLTDPDFGRTWGFAYA